MMCGASGSRSRHERAGRGPSGVAYDPRGSPAVRGRTRSQVWGLDVPGYAAAHDANVLSPLVFIFSLYYNAYMSSMYTTMRVWKTTTRLLKLVAAFTGESMISLLHRLVVAEAERLQLPPPSSRSTEITHLE